MAAEDFLVCPDLFSDDGGVPAATFGDVSPDWGLDDLLDPAFLPDPPITPPSEIIPNPEFLLDRTPSVNDVLDPGTFVPGCANQAYYGQLDPKFFPDLPTAPTKYYWAQHPLSTTAGLATTGLLSAFQPAAVSAPTNPQPAVLPGHVGRQPTYLTAWAFNANLADFPVSESRRVLDSPRLAVPAPARENANLVGHPTTELQEKMWSWFPQERFSSASQYLSLGPTSVETGRVLNGFQHPAVQALNLRLEQYPDAAATQAVIEGKWDNMGAGGRAKYGHRFSAMFPDFAVIDEMVVQKMRLARHPEWSNDALGLDPSKKFSLKNNFELDEEHERLYKSRCTGANKSASKDARSSSISSTSSQEGATAPRKGERQWVYLAPMEHSHAILLWAHGKDHSGRDTTFERIKKVFATDCFPKDVVAAWITEQCPTCHAKLQRAAATKAANAACKGNPKRKRDAENEDEHGGAQRPRL